jgi:predicted Zn-dependent protease
LGEQTVRELMASGSMPLAARQRDVQDYVRNLSLQIARNSDLEVPLQVSVLDNPAPWAISLPGGFLFVNTGLLVSAQSESQLATALAREIGKIAARHGTRTPKGAVLAKLFGPAAQVATGFLTGGPGSAGMYYSMNYGLQGLGGLMDRALTGTSEKSRREADQLAVQYAWRAGFDPRGFIAYIDTIAGNEDAAGTAGLFDKRAQFEKRVMDVFSEIAYLPPAGRPFNDSLDFKLAKALVTP